MEIYPFKSLSLNFFEDWQSGDSKISEHWDTWHIMWTASYLSKDYRRSGHSVISCFFEDHFEAVCLTPSCLFRDWRDHIGIRGRSWKTLHACIHNSRQLIMEYVFWQVPTSCWLVARDILMWNTWRMWGDLLLTLPKEHLLSDQDF